MANHAHAGVFWYKCDVMYIGIFILFLLVNTSYACALVHASYHVHCPQILYM